MSTEAAGGDEIRRFEEQYRRNPDSLVFARLADAHRKAGDPDRALQLLDDGIRRHRDYPSAHIIRARTFIDLERAEDADAAFRHVLELDAQNLVAMRGLADLTEARGDHAAAADWYERIAALDPLNEEASEALSRLRGADDPAGGVTGSGDMGAGGMESLEPTSEVWWTSSSPVSPAPPEPPTDPGRSERLPDDVAEELGLMGDELESSLPAEEEGPHEPGLAEYVPTSDEEAESVPAATAADPETDGHPGSDGDPQPSPESAVDGESGGAWWFEDPGESDPADDGDLLTRTMADLYARQGLVDEAAAIYRELLVDRPGDPELERALAGLGERLEEPSPPERIPAPRDAPRAAAEPSDETVEPRAPVVDPYASHDVPAVAGRSEVFLEWLRRLK